MQELNPQVLLDLVNKTMPFGKYKGTLYYQIPVNYLEWMNRQGFPKGNIGMLLSTLYEIKWFRVFTYGNKEKTRLK